MSTAFITPHMSSSQVLVLAEKTPLGTRSWDTHVCEAFLANLHKNLNLQT